MLHWAEEGFAWRGQMGPSVDLWQGRARASHSAFQPRKQRLQWRNGEDFAQWRESEGNLGLLHWRDIELCLVW
jgi:hypothetical protein